MAPDLDRNGMLRALVPMPDDLWPDTVMLSSIVRRSRVHCNAAGKIVLNEAGTVMKTGVSKFKDWALRDPRWDEIHGEWVLAGMQSLEYENESMEFFWAPARAAEDLTTPVMVSGNTQSYTWEDVLIDLNMVLDRNYAGSGDKNQIAAPRRYFIRGGSMPTTIERRVYVSNTELTLSAFVKDLPMPTEVVGIYNGKAVHLEPCLHPKLDIEDVGTAEVVVKDCVPSRRGERIAAKRNLAATNHTEWQRHVFSATRRVFNGLIFLIVEIAHPPPMPPITVR